MGKSILRAGSGTEALRQPNTCAHNLLAIRDADGQPLAKGVLMVRSPFALREQVALGKLRSCKLRFTLTKG